MNKKIGLGRWIIVVVLSLIVVPSIILTMFVLPIEMIALNQESYNKILEDSQYGDQMSPVIAEVLTDQVLLTNGVPPVLVNRQSFKSIVSEYIPRAWSQDVLFDLVGNTLNYFNFKTPYASIEIDIEDLKDSLVSNSAAISDDFILSLESCQNQDIITAETAISLDELPPCKLAIGERAAMSGLLAVYLEDRVIRLPKTLNLVGLIPSGMILGDRTFYWYSIARWLFRLLPFIVLLLLILIALILKSNKKAMRGWTGWMLIAVAGIVLVASVILLIGMDQFLGLLLNRPLSMLIAGFGNILLSLARHLANRMLVWIIAQAGALFLFGLILMLAGKYAKVSEPDHPQEEMDLSEMHEDQIEKEIIPQTLEEIEQEEKESDAQD
jgi:hypothetical protein